MRTVSDVLAIKGNQVWSVEPGDTVFDALRALADHDIGALLVLDAGRLVGIFSERDYARKVALTGRSSKDSRVSEVMSSHVVCVTPERSVDHCLAVMTEKRLRHLPVLDHKQLVGLVSIGDLVKSTIAEQADTIEQLEQYIMG